MWLVQRCQGRGRYASLNREVRVNLMSKVMLEEGKFEEGKGVAMKLSGGRGCR